MAKDRAVAKYVRECTVSLSRDGSVGWVCPPANCQSPGSAGARGRDIKTKQGMWVETM